MVMRPAVKRTGLWGVLSVAGVTLAVAWPVAAQDSSEERGRGDHGQDGDHDHDGGHGPSRCSEVEFSVSLADDSPDTYRVVGELCVPRGGRADTLQILIHGSTYNRSYWDFPFQSHRYSYVRHANQAGFATLAIDRLGSGESDHPAPEIISVHGTAHTVHQIVSAVRSGSHHAADGRRLDFDRIVLVGHSFGSNISWTEAGIYGDVDGLILTAISHDMNPPAAPLTQTLSYPAAFDPAFAGAGFPLGYLTTIPGARAELFYHVPGADPDVIAVDEATKDVIPVGVLFDQFTTYGLTQNIHVPVLNVVGNFDTLACQLPSCDGSGSIANEGSNYPADADYTQLIVPEAGHSVNLHRNAPAWYRQAQAWVHDRVESHGHGH